MLTLYEKIINLKTQTKQILVEVSEGLKFLL